MKSFIDKLTIFDVWLLYPILLFALPNSWKLKILPIAPESILLILIIYLFACAAKTLTNQTAVRFGYPDTLVREYGHWLVLLREAQATLGSLILCAKADVTGFSALPAEAFAEMGAVVRDIERVLKAAFSYDKINYMMLMMVDPNVHFHVIPRYAEPRSACG